MSPTPIAPVPDLDTIVADVEQLAKEAHRIHRPRQADAHLRVGDDLHEAETTVAAVAAVCRRSTAGIVGHRVRWAQRGRSGWANATGGVAGI